MPTITIEGENKGPGRKGIPIVYREVDDHIEGTITSKGSPFVFKIDKEDLEKVLTRHWYAASGGLYVGSQITVHGKLNQMPVKNRYRFGFKPSRCGGLDLFTKRLEPKILNGIFLSCFSTRMTYR